MGDRPVLFDLTAARTRGLITTGYHLPYNPALKGPARILRKKMTPAERKIWRGYLRHFRYPVLRQKPVDHYIVDFYPAALKLVIEIDGESHATKEGKAYDACRTEVLEGYGLRVLRFSNRQVMDDFESVCRRIEAEIPLTPLP